MMGQLHRGKPDEIRESSLTADPRRSIEQKDGDWILVTGKKEQILKKQEDNQWTLGDDGEPFNDLEKFALFDGRDKKWEVEVANLDVTDTVPDRLASMRKTMIALVDEVKAKHTGRCLKIMFPYLVGSGIGGGKWEDALSLIQKVAKRLEGKADVYIAQNPDHFDIPEQDKEKFYDSYGEDETIRKFKRLVADNARLSKKIQFAKADNTRLSKEIQFAKHEADRLRLTQDIDDDNEASQRAIKKHDDEMTTLRREIQEIDKNMADDEGRWRIDDEGEERCTIEEMQTAIKNNKAAMAGLSQEIYDATAKIISGAVEEVASSVEEEAKSVKSEDDEVEDAKSDDGASRGDQSDHDESVPNIEESGR